MRKSIFYHTNRAIEMLSLSWVFKRTYLPFLVSLAMATLGHAQPISDAQIQQMVASFKADPRGPYQAIRWFCPDGTLLPPQERCSQPGGIQHAFHKEIVQKLADENGIYLGQILAGTPIEVFLDATHQNSRLKQYQLEKFLQAVDDGWIMRRARYYRGAIQAEDEEAWGLAFLLNLAAREEILESQYYLFRQAAKDIPHTANQDRWQSIRAISQNISDSLAAFMDLRIKLHGSPDAADLPRVKNFRKQYSATLSPAVQQLFERLIGDLEIAFTEFDVNSLQKYLAALPPQALLTLQLKTFIQLHASQWQSQGALLKRCNDLAAILFAIRQDISTLNSAKARLTLIDLSIELENVLYREIGAWQPQNIQSLIQKTAILAKAATGCGFLELWEWQTIEPLLRVPETPDAMTYAQLRQKAELARRIVEWGAGMVNANYTPVVERFAKFEPLARGFIDDRIRASILLRLGETAGRFSMAADHFSSSANQVLDLPNPGGARGLNPGFAEGELVVVTSSQEEIEFETDKIYVMQRTPDAMKPVAGIATVAEGNLVSHVQLLARNLGIPNAILPQQHLTALAAFSGQRIFYAVSPGGTVVMKLASQMTEQERSLVAVRARSEQKINVPLGKLDVQKRELLSLKRLRAKDSGRYCGPKAANLGELKHLFPQHVVDGIVIPFGVFYAHMQQKMPGSNDSYWHFLNDIFLYERDERDVGVDEAEIEKRTLESLGHLRDAIRKIEFLPGFREQLAQKFREELGSEPGGIAVFIRSDTNMEDLEDFTGAGLNLTVFNVVDGEKILQGIRDVWASPYTERSYRWRQNYLLNPENVYPSILIIPTVNVEKSGVMITTGVSSGQTGDVTVAFSRGAGGAVEGQAAESYLLREKGTDLLLAPSRELQYTILPASGGIRKGTTSFERRLLSEQDLSKLRAFSTLARQKLSQAAGMPSGPFDIELGFLDGKIWLFQVRPYVENRRAQSTAYLQALDPVLPHDRKIPLTQKLSLQP